MWWLWLLGIPLGLAAIVEVYRRRSVYRRVGSTCHSCGYSLQGLAETGCCPECGEKFDQATGRRKLRAGRAFFVLDCPSQWHARFIELSLVPPWIMAAFYAALGPAGKSLRDHAISSAIIIILNGIPAMALCVFGMVARFRCHLRAFTMMMCSGMMAVVGMLLWTVAASERSGPGVLGRDIENSAVFYIAPFLTIPVVGFMLFLGWLVALLPWFNRPLCVKPPTDSTTSGA